METKRFWALDNPDGWYALYYTPAPPYYNMIPLAGIASVRTDEGEDLVGIAATDRLWDATQPADDWTFITFVLRGSMNDDQEATLKAQLAERGQWLIEQQTVEPEPVPAGPRTRSGTTRRK